MARAEDYVGLLFPPFYIEEHIGYGREVEVYQVLHGGTSRHLALRLPGSEDRLWEGEPMCPPANASLERRIACNAFLLNCSAKPQTPYYYGVRDGRYLIPLAAPYRVAGSLGIDEVLDSTPQGFLSGTEFLEELALGVAVALLNEAAGTQPPLQNWLPWIAGDASVIGLVRHFLDGMASHVPREAMQAGLIVL